MIPNSEIVRFPLEIALRAKAESGQRGSAVSKVIAAGNGWRVADVLCTSGPRDQPFEERYGSFAISLVLAGAFFYRGGSHESFLSPGAFLLGNHGDAYECSHEHGEGDRCLSFQYGPDLFEHIVEEEGSSPVKFQICRLPPLQVTAPLAARAVSTLSSPRSFDELVFELAVLVLEWSSGGKRERRQPSRQDRARIADLLRCLESGFTEQASLAMLARMTELSEFHFLRMFKSVTGVTPHQWLLRTRLREAARQLALKGRSVTDIAMDTGFGDLANFIRAFRAEFGVPPSRYRMI